MWYPHVTAVDSEFKRRLVGDIPRGGSVWTPPIYEYLHRHMKSSCFRRPVSMALAELFFTALFDHSLSRVNSDLRQKVREKFRFVKLEEIQGDDLHPCWWFWPSPQVWDQCGLVMRDIDFFLNMHKQDVIDVCEDYRHYFCGVIYSLGYTGRKLAHELKQVRDYMNQQSQNLYFAGPSEDDRDPDVEESRKAYVKSVLAGAWPITPEETRGPVPIFF